MSAPNHGFAVMRTPLALARAYDSSPVGLANRPFVNQLRALLPHVRPELYRGIGRYPLNADYNYGDPGWQWANRDNPSGEERARERLAEILGVGGDDLPQEEWLINGPWLVSDLPLAEELLALIQKRADYEIIEAARQPSRTRAVSLGFDVGYWASGNFSLVCDTAIWPLWHPPDAQAIEQLKIRLNNLNAHGLFPAAESAFEFREWYRTQTWAEEEDATESGLFEVVEVGLIEPRR
jgi:hypothetical protein